MFAEGYFQAVAALKDEPTLAADEPGDEATEADQSSSGFLIKRHRSAGFGLTVSSTLARQRLDRATCLPKPQLENAALRPVRMDQRVPNAAAGLALGQRAG